MLRCYYFKYVIVLFFSLLLFGCGGGSGSKSSNNNTVAASGSVTKGPIKNAKVAIYSINSDGSRGAKLAGNFVTNSQGVWQGNLPKNAQAPVLVVATEGNYIDEATGNTVTLAAGEELTSFIENIPTDGSAVTASVSPLTHAMTLSAQKIANDGSSLAAAFSQVSSNASSTFGFNPTTEKLFDPADMPATATSAQQQYAALLGGLSNLVKDAQDNHGMASAGSFALVAAFAEDLADGHLDGNGLNGGPINVASLQLPSLDENGLDALKNHANTFASGQTNIANNVITDLSGDPLTTQPTYAITGEIIGANEPVTWQLNIDSSFYNDGRDGLGSVNFNGAAGVLANAQYELVVNTPPSEQVCSVENGNGTITSDVNNIVIRCQDVNTDSYAISAIFSGLDTGVNLLWTLNVDGIFYNDGGNPNGTVILHGSNKVESGKSYELEVVNPAGQSCIITNGSGLVGTADITDIEVLCQDVAPPASYSVSGSVNGASGNVTWEILVDGQFHNDGGDGNGNVDFTGSSLLDAGANYSVSVLSEPSGQSCTVINGTGTINGDVNNVQITCQDQVAESYSVSGSISGASGNVTWEILVDGQFHNDGGDGNGNVDFTGSNLLGAGDDYSVSVISEPSGQSCTVNNGSGTVQDNVANIVISCVDDASSNTDSLVDFSQYDFNPQNPELVPSPPQSTPLDPSDKIASLFSQLIANENQNLAGATKPGNVIETVTEVYDDYYILEQRTPDNSWYRLLTLSHGADQQPDTPDDILISYAFMPYGNPGLTLSYEHAGADDTWFTSDDILVAGNNGFVLPEGELLEYQGASEGAVLLVGALLAGDDNAILTLDDQPLANSYQIVVLDGAGNRGQVVVYNGSGSDNQWFTADDRVQSYSLVSFDNQGNQVASVNYNSEGVDGVWFTSDDNVLTHTQIALDANYKPEYAVTYNGRGSDSSWFTADDTILSISFYGYSADGNPVLVATHSNKGADGIWFTADDSASAILDVKNSLGLTTVSANLTSFGPDGKWLTGDETLGYYTYADYDANGNKTHNANYFGDSGKGSDGVWFTADDKAQSYGTWRREYDNQNRVILDVAYDNSLSTAATFDDVNAISYKIYKFDYPSSGITSSVSAYRSSWNGNQFGADSLPFTEDDLGVYQINTSNGWEQYAGPGIDAVYFTEDDNMSAYYQETYDGNRLISSRWYQGAGADGVWKTADDELNLDASFNAEGIQANGDHDFINVAGTSKHEIEEDSNGFPLWTTVYSKDESNNWQIYSLSYTERDNQGHVLKTASAYSPGVDGQWRTDDDFSYWYGTTGFDVNGEAVDAITVRDPGADGVWFTADDVITYDAILALQNDTDTLATKTGFGMDRCADMASSATASIALTVTDGFGNALADATAMLESTGETVVTDAQGKATFTSVTGNQNVHVFKDDHSWESFLCVTPSATTDLAVVLHGEASYGSKVPLRFSGLGNVTFRLLDANGKNMSVIDHQSNVSPFNSSYQTLLFNVPAGTEVTGTLWAFKADNSGLLMDAVSVGEATFTTLAVDANDWGNYQDVTATFNDPELLWQSVKGVELKGTGDVGLGDLDLWLTPVYGGAATNYKYVVNMPNVTLPATAEPLHFGVPTRLQNGGYAMNAGVAANIADGAFTASFTSNIVKTAVLQDQEDSSSTPSVQWLPVKLKQDLPGSVVSLQIFSSSAFRDTASPAWVVHAPAGTSQVTLPTPPAGINDPMLDENFYRLRLSTYMIDGLEYQQLLQNYNVHQLPLSQKYEADIRGGVNNDSIRLNR